MSDNGEWKIMGETKRTEFAIFLCWPLVQIVFLIGMVLHVNIGFEFFNELEGEDEKEK